MSFHDSNIDNRWLLDQFAPVSLDDLNEKAAMLARIDNKYVVPRDALRQIKPHIIDCFEILEISNRRAFRYDTRYFDDAQRSAYYEHHQGARKGFKVRIRRYADTGLCFLEVKVKGKRGQTVKSRLPYELNRLNVLREDAIDFARTVYSNHYGKPFKYILQPALDLQYQRVTLVAKEGCERITIDTNITFWGGERSAEIGRDVFIVETKSDNGRGDADLAFGRAGLRPTKRCSKYCIGMTLTGQISRWNAFLPTMRKMGLKNGAIPQAETAVAEVA